MLLARNILFEDHHDRCLKDPKKIQLLRDQLQQGDVIIFRNVFSETFLTAVQNYLIRVAQNSLPQYQPITEGCANSHRMNRWDERSYVKGCFHQFSFFPWNQDYFNFFEKFKNVFQLKNLLNQLPVDRFLGQRTDEQCIARLSFQFYPQGGGELHKHSDPVDFHQLVVPLLTMSKKGRDFKSGGGYIENQEGRSVLLDDLCSPGDLIYTNASIPHGVEKIDADSDLDWLQFKGRWILLFAVNKTVDNTRIQNATDLSGS